MMATTSKGKTARATKIASRFHTALEQATVSISGGNDVKMRTKFSAFLQRSCMNARAVVTVISAVCFLALAAPLAAHHGTGVAYEVDRLITVEGTVTEWIWSNPHCGLLFDVTDDKGKTVHWGAELGPPHGLSQVGYSKDVFKVGDKVTVVGHPARSGTPRLELRSVTTADGRVLPEKGVKGNGVKLTDESGQ